MSRASTMFSMQSLSGGSIIWLPNPDKDSANNLIATLVNSGRNADAVVTAQKIGREKGNYICLNFDEIKKKHR